jgi:hypothetical protein
VNRTTHKIIWNYTRFNNWLGYMDLQQEASLAALQASLTWSPFGGANLDTYTNRAIALSLRRYTVLQRSPVSAGAQAVERKLAGVFYVSFDTGHEKPVYAGDRRERRANRAALDEMLKHESTIEHRIDMARATAAIRRLIDEHPDGWLAKDVLLGERKARDVAHELGIPSREVRRAARLVKRALASAPELAAFAGG